MKQLSIIIKPDILEKVKNILNEEGSGGMTVTTVMGCGTQKGFKNDNHNSYPKLNINLLPKIRVEAVVPDYKVEPIIERLRETVITGNIGDGKVFISPIEDAVRLRTGERGDDAL